MEISFAGWAFGCRVNQAEQEKLYHELTKSGWAWDANSPDYFIINTCAITAKAVREVRQLIYQTVRKHPKIKIILLGCAVSGNLHELGKLPNVHLALDNTHKPRLAETLIEKLGKSKNHNCQPYLKFLDAGRHLIKIQDGCNRQCAYCIVPQLRGHSQVVPTETIINEIKRVEAPEVILTAINTEGYDQAPGCKLSGLLEQIATQTTVRKLSLGSVNPWSLTPDFLKIYRQYLHRPLAPFLHVPMQSGSEAVLRRMRRGYVVGDWLSQLETIANWDKHLLLASDFIVGFPGETETEFAETLEFFRRSPLQRAHVFRFSPRPETPALQLANQLGLCTPTEAKRRVHLLSELSQAKFRDFLNLHVGEDFSALVLNEHDVLLTNQVVAHVSSILPARSTWMQVRIKGIDNNVQLQAHVL